jgi:hypothetical protein
MAKTSGPFKDLQEASYAKIGPLYMSGFQDAGNLQDIAKYRYPHGEQQDAEPMGIAPQSTTGEFLFFNSIDPNLYPGRLLQVRKAIRSRDPDYFNHPVDGPILGYFTAFNISHDASERNGCRVRFEFQRIFDFADLGADPTTTVRDPIALAESVAPVADTGLAALGFDEPKIPGGSFVRQVAAWRTLVETPSTTVSDITGGINDFRRNCESVLALSELGNPENYEVYRAITTAKAALTRSAQAASAQAAQVIEWIPEEKTTPEEIALRFYDGDPTMPDRIVTLNPMRFFFYPRDVKLILPDGPPPVGSGVQFQATPKF